MFLGEFEHTIDDKGRVAVPARFRDQVADGLVVTRGFDRCLQAFPRTVWQELAQRLNELPLGRDEVRSLRRLLFAGAAELDFDKQGRILLPQNLREYAALRDQVIIAGMSTYFELWSAATWGDVLTDLNANAGDMAEHLAALGL